MLQKTKYGLKLYNSRVSYKACKWYDPSPLYNVLERLPPGRDRKLTRFTSKLPSFRNWHHQVHLEVGTGLWSIALRSVYKVFRPPRSIPHSEELGDSPLPTWQKTQPFLLEGVNRRCSGLKIPGQLVAGGPR